MKNVVIASLLLLAVIIFTVLSSLHSTRSLDNLIEMASALSDKPSDATEEDIKQLENEWEKNWELYSIIVNFNYVNNVSREISNVRSGYTADDAGTYLAAKNALLNALDYIRHTQIIALDNII